MNYCYVLLSERAGNFYIGSTRDLRQRVKERDAGRVHSTAYRCPLRLVYYEASWSAYDAQRRERYLKSRRGGRYLKQSRTSWLREIRSGKLERH
jgi:putative endonuclease